MRLAYIGSLSIYLGLSACSPAPSSPKTESLTPSMPLEIFSGGDATTFVSSNDAFSQRPNAIAKNFRLDGAFTTGDHLFRSAQNGVGPLFNNPNCQGCHLNDGRGVVPTTPQTLMTSMLFKLGDSLGKPDPNYGDQLQPFALNRVATLNESSHVSMATNGLWRIGEGTASVSFEIKNGHYSDGEAYQLRQPIYRVSGLQYGPLSSDIQFSPRVAPQVFGVGLLEAIPIETLKAQADPNDTNKDGISGRIAIAYDILTQLPSVGRFAYKAQAPSVLQQVASAFSGDSGITSSLLENPTCLPTQADCLANLDENSDIPDINNEVLAFIEFYNRTLAVPARRGYNTDTHKWQEPIIRGQALFNKINCQGCHVAQHKTGVAKGSALGAITLQGLSDNATPIEVLSEQTIFPYTDMLVHDMGGECEVTLSDGTYTQQCSGLADGLPQGNVSGSEWRTPPLWGIGLVQTVNPNATFLHDGRARTIEEAVLWHGGEATQSLKQFKQLSKNERSELLAFLGSL